MTNMEKLPKAKREQKEQKPLLEPEQLDALMDSYGLERTLKSAYYAVDEARFKNKFIIGLFIVLVLSVIGNVIQYHYTPEPKVLHCNERGECIPIPTMDQPLYSDKEILSWAEQCVRTIYDMSYVNWTTNLQNNTGCLSDAARKSFAGSLKEIGVLDLLNTEYQGVTYATTQQAVLRQGQLDGEKGYYQWVVDVPFRITIDGKRKGSLDVTMTMLIRRVSMNVRDKGLWTETYMVTPRSGGR